MVHAFFGLAFFTQYDCCEVCACCVWRLFLGGILRHGPTSLLTHSPVINLPLFLRCDYLLKYGMHTEKGTDHT